ncbi:DNA repair and recombination protein RadB [uncultured archaeon]|nr:DNA repair and recombination protein RadB [uncultured archaeon]
MSELDKLLGGGIAPGTITDIFGPSGIGKTQIAMQICVNSIKDGKIIFQDTSGGFRPERLVQLIKSKRLDDKLLDKIMIARVTNIAEQIEYVNKISKVNPVLLVIDSITDLFSFEYSRESNSLEKHVKFMEYMHVLGLLSIRKKIPIVVTNTVRQSNESERESLDKSISMFTHKKIRLAKSGPKFRAEVLPTFGRNKVVYYKIMAEGVVELP